MKTILTSVFAAASVSLTFAARPAVGQQGNTGRFEIVRSYLDFSSYVVGGSVEPNWLDDGNRFWFAAEGSDVPAFWLVDPLRESVTPYTPTGGEAVRDSGRSGLASPGGRHTATTRDGNLWLQVADQAAARLTDDGEDYFAWDLDSWPFPAGLWSPDGTRLAVRRTDQREAPRIPTVHYDEPRERLSWQAWVDEAGSRSELAVFLLPNGARRTLEVKQRRDLLFLLTWHPDGRRLYALSVEYPFYRRIDLYEFDTDSGEAKLLLTENAEEGYLWDHPERESLFTLLPERNQFVWKSLRDGWSQLYLYDLDGMELRRLTHGKYPVERVVTADEREGWLYFVARAEPKRIYDTHLYRVDFNGSNFARLTVEPGQHESRFILKYDHEIRFSPSKRFFLDSHSSPRRPPRVDLRRADGTLVRTIAEADVEPLEELGWERPEEFVVTAADGETPLHGILYKPYDFDPTVKYPVLNYVYGSSASISTVPRTFVPNSFGKTAQALAQLGFVTFIVDARGGAGRSKAFRDAVYGGGGLTEITDQVAALRQLAETRPYLDLDRVGITGGSYGGYMAVLGMLAAPDAYSVGVAIAPISILSDHYNAVYVGPTSTDSRKSPPGSTIALAQNLKGKLLIIHGTADQAVPIGHTMRLVDAFVRANKAVDMVIMPDMTHGSPELWEGYGWDARARYLDEHLLYPDHR